MCSSSSRRAVASSNIWPGWRPGPTISSRSLSTQTSCAPGSGVAERILGLRKEVEQLEVLLPICSYCKRIRNARDEWEPLEAYIEAHFERQLTHGICSDCYVKHVQPQLDRGGGNA